MLDKTAIFHPGVYLFLSRCSWARSACGPWWGWLTVPTAAACPPPGLVPTTAVTSWRVVWPTRLTSTLSGGIWPVGSTHTLHMHPIQTHVCSSQLFTLVNISHLFVLTVAPVFVETMMQVAGRFDGPSGVDAVVLSLPSRISEAMLTMTDNMETINSKVRTHNGKYSWTQLT